MFKTHNIFKDKTLQKHLPFLKSHAQVKGLESTLSIKEAMIGSIVESITEEAINVSSKNTTLHDNNQVLKASKL